MYIPTSTTVFYILQSGLFQLNNYEMSIMLLFTLGLHLQVKKVGKVYFLGKVLHKVDVPYYSIYGRYLVQVST